MATKLDAFLDKISPENTIEKTEKAADKALNSFQIRDARIESWEEFKHVMADFYCLTECHILGFKKIRSSNLYMDWGRCSNLLCKKYGMRGDRAAFNMSRTGVEGGLYGVLKFVAETLANQFADNWVQCRISAFWENLSHDERMSVPIEYLEKFRHILPPEILEQNPYLFVANFYRFLEHHPQMRKNLKNIR